MIFQKSFVINSTVTNFVKVISEGLDIFFLRYMDKNYILFQISFIFISSIKIYKFVEFNLICCQIKILCTFYTFDIYTRSILIPSI